MKGVGGYIERQSNQGICFEVVGETKKRGGWKLKGAPPRHRSVLKREEGLTWRWVPKHTGDRRRHGYRG